MLSNRMRCSSEGAGVCPPLAINETFMPEFLLRTYLDKQFVSAFLAPLCRIDIVAGFPAKIFEIFHHP